MAIDGNKLAIAAPFGASEGAYVGRVHLYDSVTGALQRTFNDPTPTFRDGFGYSLAMDNRHLLISAPWDYTNGTRVGQAHLFDVYSGQLLRTFDDPTPTNGGWFGWSMALAGDRVLIGCPGDSTKGVFAGQAHLFDITTGTLLSTFDDPTPTAGDFFGWSVALSGDQVLVGAYEDHTLGKYVGQAHLFDAITGDLLHTFNDPSPIGGDRFGTSVAIEGGHVVIGAPGHSDNTGQAHLFDAITGVLLHTFDNPVVTEPYSFGYSVAIEGDSLLISAPGDALNITQTGQAHVFNKTTGKIIYSIADPTLNNAGFGTSVMIDRNRILIGDPFDSWAGQVHVFVPESPAAVLLVVALGLLISLSMWQRRSCARLDSLKAVE